MPTNIICAQAITSDSSNIKTPTITPDKTIDFSDVGYVMKMTFSPDGRYLAVVVDPDSFKTDIVVWDMQLQKRQSHIHCEYNYGIMRDHDLLWSRDGKVLSFGAVRQWDAMTGASLPNNPVIGRAARLNKDGTKLLTIVGAIGDPSYIHVYDTDNWALQKIYTDGLSVETAAWTAENKIVIGVSGANRIGETVDGHLIKTGYEVALRLLDPSGKTPTIGVWFPANPREEGSKYGKWKKSFDINDALSNFKLNKIALGAGQFIDGKTLAVTNYYSKKEIYDGVTPLGTTGWKFTPDGKFLLLKNGVVVDGSRPTLNAIIDTTSNKSVAQFVGGDMGIDIHPDGMIFAMGDTHSVKIFNIKY